MVCRGQLGWRELPKSACRRGGSRRVEPIKLSARVASSNTLKCLTAQQIRKAIFNFHKIIVQLVRILSSNVFFHRLRFHLNDGVFMASQPPDWSPRAGRHAQLDPTVTQYQPERTPSEGACTEFSHTAP